MKTQIALRHLNSVVVEPTGSVDNTALAATLSASMMELGFIPSKDLLDALKSTPTDELTAIYNDLIPALKKSKGADVKYTPMYPNFPKQVMDMSYIDLFLNAIIHYWTLGEWKPSSVLEPRQFHFESTKFKEVGVATEDEFNGIFTTLLSSNESISDTSKETIEWFLANIADPQIPDTIPYKENLCLLAGHIMKTGGDLSKVISTTTDILRLTTYLSGGDVSLAENTRFKSLPRPTRRKIIAALESVAKEEDFARHRNKWVKLFHSLHVGEYSPALYEIAKKLRNNKRISTFNGEVEAAIGAKDVTSSVNLLKTRPTEFARRLDHLLRIFGKKTYIINEFLSVVDRVPTRVLLQVLGNLKVRGETVESRVVFPKATAQRAIIVNSKLEKLSKTTIVKLRVGIEESLRSRFNTLDDLGKVYIDPQLADCPIPTQQRSANNGTFSVARGTRLPIADDKNTLRFFVYWIGQDIDLSATMYDKEFELAGHISYTNLKNLGIGACHSGDIVDAPNGASEFIDIDIDKALSKGIRYVAMNVLVYSGPKFSEHEKVYAGWMTRSKPQSNEIYEPKTVEQKLDLTSDTSNSIPVVFDLLERKAIWADLSTSLTDNYGGNNVESNRASIKDTVEAITTLSNKVTLFELFTLHAQARGVVVSEEDSADTVFDMQSIHAVDLINSEYIDG